MTKTAIKEIKEKLLAERQLLIEKLKGSDLSIDDSETPDPVDLAVRNYSKNVQLAVSENESKQLTHRRSVDAYRGRRIRPLPKLRKGHQSKAVGRDPLGTLLPRLPGTARAGPVGRGMIVYV